MKESSFRFSNPGIVYMKFVENSNFRLEQEKEIEIGTKIQVKHNETRGYECDVNVAICIGEESEAKPFLLEIEVSACFKWDESVEKDKVDFLLNQNAPALLISYARPIVAMITNASHYPVYNLPFIDLTGER